MADGFAELDAQMARLRSLRTLTRDAMAACAEVVLEELRAQIGRGTDATGRKWQPRKADGGQPLEDAAAALVVVPVGSTVFCRLKGHIARHHKGIAKGGVARPIFPTTPGMPSLWVRGIQRVLRERFEQTMGVR